MCIGGHGTGSTTGKRVEPTHLDGRLERNGEGVIKESLVVNV